MTEAQTLLTPTVVVREALCLARANGITHHADYMGRNLPVAMSAKSRYDGLEAMVVFSEKPTLSICDEVLALDNADLALSLGEYSTRILAPFIRRLAWDTPYLEGVLPI